MATDEPTDAEVAGLPWTVREDGAVLQVSTASGRTFTIAPSDSRGSLLPEVLTVLALAVPRASKRAKAR
jgi:hypothetical protein